MRFEEYALIIIVIVPPFVAALISLLVPKIKNFLDWITIISSALSLAASIVVSIYLKAPIRPSYESDIANIIYVDELSVYFILLVNIVAFIASCYTIPFLDFDKRHNRFHNRSNFHVFFNLFHFTMLVVPIVDNLVLLWIFIELTTVFSSLLVRYRRNRASLEAAWKFIIITTTGIIFALLGTLFMVSASNNSSAQGLIESMQWSFLAKSENAKNLNPTFVILSFLFILIGYGTKAGLAPMHTWLPDGHGEAPAPVSALLSGVMLKSALYAILRFYTIAKLSSLENTSLPSSLLLGAGLFSLIIATPFILKRNRFKRVLAYHSLEHMGIITFGIGLGTPIALFGALLHALNHALTKTLMFLIYGNIYYEHMDRARETDDESKLEDSVQGVIRSMPISGTILTFGGLALVGAPPFNIFMSEFIIMWAAVQKALVIEADAVTITIDPWFAAALVIFLITVTAIFGGLVGHISRLLLGKPLFNIVELTRRKVLEFVVFGVLVGLIFLFGILIPNPLTHLIEQSGMIINQGVTH